MSKNTMWKKQEKKKKYDDYNDCYSLENRRIENSRLID